MPSQGKSKKENDAKQWDTSELLKDLESIYKKKNAEAAWSEEKDGIGIQLTALSQKLSISYEDVVVLDRGGSGIILKARNIRLYSQVRVIKFPRPIRKQGAEFAKLLDNEIELLASIRSRFVVTIHEAGKAELNEEVGGISFVPFYIMDFIDGDDSDNYIKNNPLSFDTFIRIIQESFEAINCLHDADLIHLDIKPANIRINKSSFPVLVDLGTTKKYTEENIHTTIATTYRYAPSSLYGSLKIHPEDPSRSVGSVLRKDLKFNWDLHYLSQTLQEWIDAYIVKNKLTAYQRKYLSLLALRLFQDPYQNTKQYNIPIALLNEVRYKDIKTAIRDIKKLSSQNNLSEKIPEFNQSYHKTLQIGIQDSIVLTERLATTINHPLLRRLAEVSHLGIVQLVYPTCTHTRLEHTLGTYHNLTKYVWALYHDPLNPIFRQIMEPKHIKAVLLAALLHDIGQFPMAHDFEDVDSDLFSHSVLVKAIIKGSREVKAKGATKMEFPSLDSVFALWDVKREDVLKILEAKLHLKSHGIRARILKSLISGPIDADKLDYLRRDGARLNVPYPNGIDVERLLNCLTLLVKDSSQEGGKEKKPGVMTYVVVHEKGLVPAEFMIFSRYAMYSQVYWHHSVRAVKGMLARAVRAILLNLNTPEDKKAFRYNFERFVLFGLGMSATGAPIQLQFFPKPTTSQTKTKVDKEVFRGNFTGTALNSWDSDTLKYIRQLLIEMNLEEKELIDDILHRRLYKRGFIYCEDRDTDVWSDFIKFWDKSTNDEKLELERNLEKAIVKFTGEEIDSLPETTSLTPKQLDSIEVRVKAGKPLLLIDVPSDKPGSRKPLEYIIEDDRRELRKSSKICGTGKKAGAWEKYSKNLREEAGRIRVYIHPKYVDAILSVVDKSWIGDRLADPKILAE